MAGFGYSKYQSKSLYFCLRCAVEVPQNPERTSRGYAKRTYCARCKEPAQFFPSQKEYGRYRELHILEACNDISELELQPRFPIKINNKLVVTYVADFRYKDKAGTVIIEDVKGFATTLYKLKKKLVEAYYGIEILET